ncbi:unnamed protein product [Lactuca virosa]|uniref:Uncharacterized protein n=1 Tax=Lactuca virosa TaxID=75947 RepID=A0AAU9MB24_9ASTR|nr:unnamed protein product [Lactuca virosa]
MINPLESLRCFTRHQSRDLIVILSSKRELRRQQSVFQEQFRLEEQQREIFYQQPLTQFWSSQTDFFHFSSFFCLMPLGVYLHGSSRWSMADEENELSLYI